MAKKVDIENALIVSRSEYSKALHKIHKNDECPFCGKNLFKQHREPIIFEGAHWLVTNNNWPYAGTKHHFLLIHKKHVEKAEDVTPKAWAELQTLYKKLCKKYKLAGATFFMRSGDTRLTGATVAHLHAQVVVGVRKTAGAEPIQPVAGFKKKKSSRT